MIASVVNHFRLECTIPFVSEKIVRQICQARPIMYRIKMAPFDLCVDVQPQLAFSQPASPTPEASHEQRAPVNEKGDGREGGQKAAITHQSA
jgi:hypothetical protein